MNKTMKTNKTLKPIAELSVMLLAVAASAETINNDDIPVARPDGGVLLFIDAEEEVGPVKPMNAVNNGPNFLEHHDDPITSAEGVHEGRFDAFRDLSVPMTRTHDSRFMAGNPGRMNDPALIFPDFAADENDPGNYDFKLTDAYLNAIRLTGADIMYFLGSSCDTEVGGRNHGTDEPPKDPAKWARIAERIVRHYNEGWGWSNEVIAFSNQFNITHWEIWNEADLDCSQDYWEKGVRTWERRHRYWNGSPEQFFEFYGIVAKHLKATFPDLKFGGPALAGHLDDWGVRFLDYCRTNSVPLDFFSWHAYKSTPFGYAQSAARVRSVLDGHGFRGVPSYLDEWNWNCGWYGDGARESYHRRGEMNNFRIAAFYAATMCVAQDAPVDMLMYYDTRVPCLYNGLFSADAELPLKGYYAFYAWSRLQRLGRQVRARLVGQDCALAAVAARGTNGGLAVLIARCTGEANDFETVPVKVSVRGRSLAGARLHVTDEFERYTERVLRVAKDGSATVRLAPHAFAVIEL